MQKSLNIGGLATTIGSVPLKDPKKACSLLLKYIPELPGWPQLPMRSFKENMYAQFGEGLPGAILEDERFYVDRERDLSADLERLYAAYIDSKVDEYAIGRDYAAGLHTLIDVGAPGALGVKGQVTGPISFGLAVTDRNKRPLLYDDTLADAIAKHLRLKATWEERALKRVARETIIFVDEPYLASVGSAFVSIPQQQMSALLEEVLQGISGLKGIHCCGNTDWSLILPTSINILSLDAYNYGETLTLYPDQLKSFLARGGAIAWGIVPTNEEVLAKESAASLRDRLEHLFDVLGKKGIPRDILAAQCMVTPSCGLATLSPDASEFALELLATLSQQLRHGRAQV